MWRIAVPAQTSAAMARIAFTHISTAPFSDPDRAAALETQRICNRLLRLFSDLLAEVGIEIESLFQDP
jgi:hypothetical protein